MIFKCPCKESNCVGRVLQTVCLLFFIYNIYISLWSLAFIEPQTTVKSCGAQQHLFLARYLGRCWLSVVLSLRWY